MAGHHGNAGRISGFISVNWTARYIGIPFVDGGREIGGLDCWGLFRLVYSEQLGVELPSYGEISAMDLLTVARAINGGQEDWFVPPDPQEFDAVALRLYSHGWIAHVGILTDPKHVLHIEHNTDSVIVPLSHHTVKTRVAGFRRHRGCKR